MVPEKIWKGRSLLFSILSECFHLGVQTESPSRKKFKSFLIVSALQKKKKNRGIKLFNKINASFRLFMTRPHLRRRRSAYFCLSFFFD